MLGARDKQVCARLAGKAFARRRSRRALGAPKIGCVVVPLTPEQQAQTDALFQAIGRYVVSFEHVNRVLTLTAHHFLSGGDPKRQQVADVTLAGLAAESLRGLYGALVSELVPMTDEDRAIFSSAMKRFQSLIRERNDIVHTTWYIGWAGSETDDLSVASGYKLHKSGQGADNKSFQYTVADFEAKTKDAEALAGLFSRIHACVVGGFSIAKNAQDVQCQY